MPSGWRVAATPRGYGGLLGHRYPRHVDEGLVLQARQNFLRPGLGKLPEWAGSFVDFAQECRNLVVDPLIG